MVTRPVGLVDLAPTFCTIAGLGPEDWMQGSALPVDDPDAERRGFERVLTEWDSALFGVDVHVRTITRDGWVCTAYRRGTVHDGTEGELYDLSEDPLQRAQPLGRSVGGGAARRTCWPTSGTTSSRPTNRPCCSKHRSDPGGSHAMPALERKWWTLIAVCTATFMLLLDITVVNVALPDIQRSLHASFSDLQWVIDAYSLTLAAFLLTAGVVGDMVGRRGVFASGLAVFTASSLVCGLSTSSLMLNLARAAQGVGGAIMFATSLALIAAAFQGRERGTAFGIYGAVIGAAVAVGPLIGGAITSGIGWRWIFFVNVPVGVVAIGLTLTQVAAAEQPNHRRIDWIGFVSFSSSLFLLVLALVRGNDDGWGSSQIVGGLVGAVVLLAVFLVAEWRQSEPMLDLSLFRRPAMVGASVVAFTLSSSIFAMFLYLTLFMQDDLGFGPFAAGLRFLPITLLSFFAAPIAGKLSVRIQSRYLLGSGLLLVAVGLFLMSRIHTASGWTVLVPGFIVTGIGIGMVNPVLASSAVSVVPPERSGMASGPTTPSARSASPPGSPPSGPCSRVRSSAPPPPPSAPPPPAANCWPGAGRP